MQSAAKEEPFNAAIGEPLDPKRVNAFKKAIVDELRRWLTLGTDSAEFLQMCKIICISPKKPDVLQVIENRLQAYLTNNGLAEDFLQFVAIIKRCDIEVLAWVPPAAIVDSPLMHLGFRSDAFFPGGQLQGTHNQTFGRELNAHKHFDRTSTLLPDQNRASMISYVRGIDAGALGHFLELTPLTTMLGSDLNSPLARTEPCAWLLALPSPDPTIFLTPYHHAVFRKSEESTNPRVPLSRVDTIQHFRSGTVMRMKQGKDPRWPADTPEQPTTDDERGLWYVVQTGIKLSSSMYSSAVKLMIALETDTETTEEVRGIAATSRERRATRDASLEALFPNENDRESFKRAPFPFIMAVRLPRGVGPSMKQIRAWIGTHDTLTQTEQRNQIVVHYVSLNDCEMDEDVDNRDHVDEWEPRQYQKAVLVNDIRDREVIGKIKKLVLKNTRVPKRIDLSNLLLDKIVDCVMENGMENHLRTINDSMLWGNGSGADLLTVTQLFDAWSVFVRSSRRSHSRYS